MKISSNPLGMNGCSDAFDAADREESKSFMDELIALCEKHGLALVPQSQDYEICFNAPMRVVPADAEVMDELKKSWVAFEEKS